MLADSLRNAGDISDMKSSYWLGYANDKLMRKRLAEFFWNMGMATFNPDDDKEDAELYAEMASRLAGLKCTLGEYEAALKVARTAVSQLQQMGCDTTSNYTNLIIYIGYCQSRFGLNRSTAANTLEEAYQQHLGYIRQQASSDAYRLAIIGLTNICYNYFDMCEFKNLLFWANRYDSLVNCYDKTGLAADNYIDKQHGRSCVFRAKALEGLGKRSEADRAFAAFRETHYSQTPDGAILAADYQMFAQKWKEAAESWSSLDEFRKQFSVDYSLENIQLTFLKKFESNLKAGRRDSAMVTAMDILAHLDSTINVSRRTDAIEQETVRKKEAEMTAEKERMEIQQWWTRLAVMAALILALVIYIFVRNRMSARLKKAHEALKVAYDQLEETTAVKERMESELRIARNIQMSMVPSVFPDIKGLDMYASMTPAKEVGGDLYNYLLLDDKLYFCVGDVSGKGVPASLFMAQATRLFLTLAKQAMRPAEICTRMNDALSGDDNETNMFVTFWLGLVDLTTGHLTFCNAGHNPPVIGCGGDGVKFLDMLPNAPIGILPGMEYTDEEVETIKGQPLFIYTDGLNEAENKESEQFSDERLLDILHNTHFNSAQQLIELLSTEVEAHRQGAEPNDDLTMMCLRIAQ
ncbi:MAG: serine/threonine-protein phosphatase [Prevotella sp.]|nr:serine/threonine-protein phosphatase [Prevotella sp.]